MRFINPCIVALLSSIVVFAPTHATIININVEHAILSGHIIEKQRDLSTGQPKYLLHGETPWSYIAIVVTFGSTGRLDIITVFTIEE